MNIIIDIIINKNVNYYLNILKIYKLFLTKFFIYYFFIKKFIFKPIQNSILFLYYFFFFE